MINLKNYIEESLDQNVTESFGVEGAPEKKCVLFKDKSEDITVKWDPLHEYITLWSGREKYDQMDCSHYETWSEVEAEFEEQFGFKLDEKLYKK